MPRPKKPGVEPKKRSRNGCWPCKARKVKCGEEKPCCTNCQRQGERCDYSIRLNWGGRTKRDKTPSLCPYESTFQFEPSRAAALPSTPEFSARSQYAASCPSISSPVSSRFLLDASLASSSHTLTPPPNVPRALSADRVLYFSGSNDLPVAVPCSQTQFSSTFEYPSASLSGFEPFDYNSAEFLSVPADMPPPHASMDPLAKRQGYPCSLHSPATTASDTFTSNAGSPDPYSTYMAIPLTPSSSLGPEDPILRSTIKSHVAQCPPPDLRRMSVQSLIHENTSNQFCPYIPKTEQGRQCGLNDSAAITYGYDIGLPDLDSPKHDDFAAISLFNPQNDVMDMRNYAHQSIDFQGKSRAYNSGGYYAQPVPIKLPKSFGPLPPVLMDNPMNLLYFNHFLDNTARVLVPHSCEKNPFREILPELAVRDPIIMNLLLAYSAAHRARMLRHPEPSTRIAVWVQDVFPRLRHILREDPSHASDNTLAAFIMMASLGIISSSTFEVPVSWRDHLSVARQMVVARGGPQAMGRRNPVAYFLSRWFAYLDVVGSFSGNRKNMPLSSSYWLMENRGSDEDFEIDCLLGFTTRCMRNLARISELAKLCESQRVNETGHVRESWVPAPEIVQEAIHIRSQFEDGLLECNFRKRCKDALHVASGPQEAWNTAEIHATNQLFHWAGLIHLFRRVMGKSSTDVEVQHAVREIVSLLRRIRKGSAAEANLLFPMFAAGYNAIDQTQRDRILDCMTTVEGSGMNQVSNVSRLLRSIWEAEGLSESLLSDEFLG